MSRDEQGLVCALEQPSEQIYDLLVKNETLASAAFMVIPVDGVWRPNPPCHSAIECWDFGRYFSDDPFDRGRDRVLERKSSPLLWIDTQHLLAIRLDRALSDKALADRLALHIAPLIARR